MDRKPANKHKAKSEATRRALLESAERVFFRDGFELAQIDQIAADAGRTSGAIYASFKNKEHLFLSVLEARMQEIADLCGRTLARESTGDPNLRIAAFKKFYAMLHRPEWAILDLEFKLYGLRHPESIQKLKSMVRRVWRSSLFESLLQMPLRPGQSTIESRFSALNAIASAIVLNMRWEPEVMTRKQARLILSEVFGGLFPEADLQKPPRDDVLAAVNPQSGGRHATARKSASFG